MRLLAFRKRLVLFDYERTRAGYHPVNFLGNRFRGYLTCDGYQAYHSLGEGIIVSGCLTHARRRFDAALTALKKRLHKRTAERDRCISGDVKDRDPL